MRSMGKIGRICENNISGTKRNIKMHKNSGNQENGKTNAAVNHENYE